jgi:hypothetical protein
MPSNKNFAYTFFVVFLLIFLFVFLKLDSFNIYLIFISIFFFIFGYFKPVIFKLPNLLWFKFGLLLSRIIAPIVLLAIFILIVLPIGVFKRNIDKDYFRLKINKKKNTYWENTKTNINFKDQF